MVPSSPQRTQIRLFRNRSYRCDPARTTNHLPPHSIWRSTSLSDAPLGVMRLASFSISYTWSISNSPNVNSIFDCLSWAPPGGFEPPTTGLEGRCTIRCATRANHHCFLVLVFSRRKCIRSPCAFQDCRAGFRRQFSTWAVAFYPCDNCEDNKFRILRYPRKEQPSERNRNNSCSYRGNSLSSILRTRFLTVLL